MTGRRTRPAGPAGAGPLLRSLVLVAVLALAAGCGGPRAGYGGVTATVPPAAGRQGAPAGLAAVRGFESVRAYRATPVPVRLRIPAIGVDTGLQRLGQDNDGSVEVPKGPHKWDMAGWYGDGTRPGDPGSAVLLGHVDSTAGPAVFYRLRDLRPGDRVEVVRADGSRAWFAVERVARYPKTRFPTDDVYYPTLTPRLRLVTCGGSFDPRAHSYRSNVIVFAKLVS